MTASQFTSPVGRWNSLRAQFTAVIFALTFLPNLSLTLILGSGSWNSGLLLWTLGVGGLCGLIGSLLAAAMLEPLARLRTEVESSDFGAVGRPGDPSEVRALRSAFAGLLSRLSTEQGRRGAFMATLVHDLKTPLIATSHLVKLLMASSLSLPERAEVGTQMLSENTRLLALVQQMADAHRFERDAVKLNRRAAELRPLLDALVARLSTRAAELGVELSVHGQGQADIDAPVLERALGNLLDNALRYAHHRVELRVRSTEHGAEVSVIDDGPGLSESLDVLAQPFNAQPTTIAGQQYTAGTAGLGLFIARAVAEAHGGHLTYSRQATASINTALINTVLTDPNSDSPRAFAPSQDHSVLTLTLPGGDL
ncbi:HAMP domain-containing sensor histidine kinase [Deinococcus sp.]|uniref:sensor histidine kinase n=1 Tax=Deinococcus sp. TaxID=47478 RepID=UPI0025FAE540|nr:HAMP domain-containing sensor histidine kinase [Deinococcus sp.]